MSFLAPAAFWAFGLAIPVVALYLLKERVRRLAVSNILLWSERTQRLRESRGWRRLRHPLSLALQLVLLVLVVLALARPRVGAVGGPLILVLDRSASLGARDVEDSRMQAAANALASYLQPGAGPYTLLATGLPPQVLVANTRDVEEVRRRLFSVLPAEGQVNPRPTLEMARALASARGARIVFATDGVWSAGSPGGILEGVETLFVGSERAVNAGIVALAAARSPVGSDEVNVLAGVGTSAAPPDSATFRLFANGQLIEAREWRREDAMPWFQQWTLRAPEALSLEANLETKDVLAADNRALVGLPPRKKLQVVLVSPPQREFERVLEAMPGVEMARVWPPDSLTFGDPEAVYIFVGAQPPKDFQAAGVVLVLPTGEGIFGKQGEGPVWLMPDFADAASPITQHLRIERLEPLRAWNYAPAAGARLDLASGNAPLIFSDWGGPLRWTVLAFNPAEGPLAESAAFPVLMANVVEGLSGRARESAKAGGLGLALTGLERKEGVAGESAAQGSPGTGLTLSDWLLVLAVAWAVSEAWSYHRRLTV